MLAWLAPCTKNVQLFLGRDDMIFLLTGPWCTSYSSPFFNISRVVHIGCCEILINSSKLIDQALGAIASRIRYGIFCQYFFKNCLGVMPPRYFLRSIFFCILLMSHSPE